MNLSSQEEYGLRCLLQVAAHGAPEPLSIAQIAVAEGISPEYTAKLMRLLRKGGLVDSTRGAGGGYRLARQPAERPSDESKQGPSPCRASASEHTHLRDRPSALRNRSATASLHLPDCGKTQTPGR